MPGVIPAPGALPASRLDDLVGLVPAAGRATRLGPLPGSKEVLPLAYRRAPGGGLKMETALDRLLGSFATSGIRRSLVLLRQDKWDVPAWIGRGTDRGVEVAYRIVGDTASSVETLDAARPFLGADDRAALGFPDIVYHPPDTFARLAAAQTSTGAAVVLGLFPCDAPERSDMVEVAPDGAVLGVRVKQPDAGLRWAWGQAVWDRRFTDLLSRTLREAGDHPGELYPGHVVQRALTEGLPVRAVAFEDGVFLDTGTPVGLRKAVAWLEGRA